MTRKEKNKERTSDKWKEEQRKTQAERTRKAAQERQHKKEKGIQEHRHTKKETEEPRRIEAWVILRNCLFQGFSGLCKAREKRK